LFQRTGLNDSAYNNNDDDDDDDDHDNNHRHISVNIPTGKAAHGRRKQRPQDNNIKECLTKEIWYKGFDWLHPPQDRGPVIKTVLRLQKEAAWAADGILEASIWYHI
jgi:hypothetical protein